MKKAKTAVAEEARLNAERKAKAAAERKAEAERQAKAEAARQAAEAEAARQSEGTRLLSEARATADAASSSQAQGIFIQLPSLYALSVKVDAAAEAHGKLVDSLKEAQTSINNTILPNKPNISSLTTDPRVKGP